MAMREHMQSEDMMERACGVLRNLNTSTTNTTSQANNIDAFKAVVLALRTHHTGSVNVQHQACVALRNLIGGNASNIEWAGAYAFGAVKVMTFAVTAMRRHSGSSVVQISACAVLYVLTIDNVAHRACAVQVGAKEAAEAALMTHSGNKKVVREARDLLTILS
jgi:hypothetical protein